MDEIGDHTGGNVAQAEPPGAPQRPFERFGRDGRHARSRQESPSLVGGEPAVGGNVVHAGKIGRRHQRQRGNEIVDMHDLEQRRRAPDA